MVNEIYQSFLDTRRAVKAHQNYPVKAGMYALFLLPRAELPNFAQLEKLIYIGIAKDSLRKRDFPQHFKSGQSGRSTLRRSLGAVLKEQLRLAAIPRGGEGDKKRFDNYKFTDYGEALLTSWMEENLEIGYWVPEKLLTYKELRDKEQEATLEFKPILDLDRRTQRFNKYAHKLNALRQVCKLEARHH